MKRESKTRYNKHVRDKGSSQSHMPDILTRTADNNGIPGIEELLFPGGEGYVFFSDQNPSEERKVLDPALNKESVI